MLNSRFVKIKSVLRIACMSLVLFCSISAEAEWVYGEHGLKITPKLVGNTAKAVTYTALIFAFVPLVEGQRVRDCGLFVTSCLGVALAGVLLFDYQKEKYQLLEQYIQNNAQR